MKSPLFILFIISSFSGYSQTTFRIAFGSCSYQNDTIQLWQEVVNSKPDVWIWGGDNIYADTLNVDVIKQQYELQKNRPSYKRLSATCPITGTWDDHDYGINDGGKFLKIKKESKTLAANFLGFDSANTVWQHDGLYNSTSIAKNNLAVKIINLDTRYFRDTIYKSSFIDKGSGKTYSSYTANQSGDILGDEQWIWLEQEINNTTAEIILLNSSIQLIADEHRFEKWSNFPRAQEHLFQLLARYPQKTIIIISGDRHIAELSKRTLSTLPYPLYDFTSSGLTHTWSEIWEENNRFRVGELIIKKNFGLLEITISKKKILTSFFSIGPNGYVYQKIKALIREF